MSSSYDTDVAIIGAGHAGITAALLADRLGARVTLIESDRVGGSYVWKGIIPVQTLAQSGRVHDLVQRTEEFGVHLEKPRVVWAAVRLRIADVQDTLRSRQRAAERHITRTSEALAFVETAEDDPVAFGDSLFAKFPLTSPTFSF